VSHGGGGGGGEGKGGTENVHVGPLLTIVSMVPVCLVFYQMLKPKWGRILFAACLIPGGFMVAPGLTFAALAVVAFFVIMFHIPPSKNG
jgi:presenilin-like A22 family membrane protease